MKRTAFDESRDQRIADETPQGHMPCSWCNRLTHRSMLAELGARCRSCFDAYCTDPARLGPTDTITHRSIRQAIRAHNVLYGARAGGFVSVPDITDALRTTGGIPREEA